MSPMPAAYARVDTPFIRMAGGLDLASPATLIKPGFCLDATNYEIDSVNGGYQRINGFERFDGRTEPSSASYWTLDFSGTSPSVGASITGATSGATGKVLAVSGSKIVLGRVTGSFVSGESIGGGATVSAPEVFTGASDPAVHAAYSLLAANDRRADIQAVPGSGKVLGVWIYNDDVYAFRNNAGGTAAVMFKATSSGWSAVTMYQELSFSTGLAKPAEGATLYGATSTATGVVKRVLTRTGAWGSNAAGTVVIEVTSGTFQNGELVKLTNGAGATQFTAASASSTITLQPSGRFEFVNFNFTGSTSSYRMYGCDGVNPAFEFDGTVFAPIHTGMATDTPAHIAAHKNYLFLSFKGSLQNSGIGDPYAWSLVLGSSEIGAGDDITALLPQPGDATTPAMAVFTKTTTKTLYGSSPSDWKLVTASPTTGGAAYSAQFIGTAVALAERGIQQISHTIAFGDFQFATVTGLIQSLINRKIGTATASAAYKTRNQYRVFFSDNTAISMTVDGSKVAGFMPIQYDRVVRCYAVANKSNGQEYCYFGSDDGFVYRDNVGTSFDGNSIEAWLRLPFNHFGSPRYRKRFRRAVMDMVISGYASVSVSYDLGGGNPDVTASGETAITAYNQGGYWDQFYWEQFVWETPIVAQPSVSLEGTEKSISLLFYSNSNLCGQHAIGAVTFHISIRRLDR